MRFKWIKKKNISLIPLQEGVYAFKDKKGMLLYIGKASNLRERIKNHFFTPNFKDSFWINKVWKVGYFLTSSEIQALLLEANLIKKYQPKFNVLWRDDKNYFYVGITKEKLPRVFITHQPQVEIYEQKRKIQFLIGPFVDGKALKATLRVLRKVFPYYTKQKHPNTPCSYCHLGLCPGPKPEIKSYQKNIKNLIAVLEGKKKSVLKKLQKEMEKFAQEENFEMAAKIRDQIRSLERIIAHAKVFQKEKKQKNWLQIQKELQKILQVKRKISKIEAYDISNIQGHQATGSLVAFVQGEPKKNLYRRFKVKITKKPNDLAMLKEILKRRFQHQEWPLPDLILIDGGKGQLSTALGIKKEEVKTRKKIKIISLAKRGNKLYIEGKKEPIFLKTLSQELSNLLLYLRDEAHRFAISYHRKLRRKKLFNL